MTMTVHELAEQTGFSTRNIRSYQTRGLLPKPEIRNREARYGEAHVRRLEVIRKLMGEGMSLDLIQDLLDADSSSLERLLEMRQTATARETPTPLTVTVHELSERFGNDTAALDHAIEIGVVVPLADGRFSIPHPNLFVLADRAKALGLSTAAAVEVVGFAMDQANQAAGFLVELMRREVWEPFDASGRPEGEWAGVMESFSRAKPLGVDLYAELLPLAISGEARRVTGRVIEAETGAASAS